MSLNYHTRTQISVALVQTFANGALLATSIFVPLVIRNWIEYNPDFGARPLRRSIERYVEDPMSEEILRGAYEGKDIIRISIKDKHLFFEALKASADDKKGNSEKKEEVEAVDAT